MGDLQIKSLIAPDFCGLLILSVVQETQTGGSTADSIHYNERGRGDGGWGGGHGCCSVLAVPVFANRGKHLLVLHNSNRPAIHDIT